MILDEIAGSARRRVERLKAERPAELYLPLADTINPRAFCFERAINTGRTEIIAEIKRASPSAGIIDENLDAAQAAEQYRSGGAAALSVLTEPDYFLGGDGFLKAARAACPLPVLRKDFTVDEYQIYEARAIGADAVLLIVSLLTDSQLKRFMETADKLGLSCLVETKTRAEIERAAQAGARVIGINNRDLTDFSVSVKRAEELAGCLPEGALFVAESGIKDPEDVAVFSGLGAAAVLVGSSLVRSRDRAAAVRRLREGVCGRG